MASGDSSYPDGGAEAPARPMCDSRRSGRREHGDPCQRAAGEAVGILDHIPVIGNSTEPISLF